MITKIRFILIPITVAVCTSTAFAFDHINTNDTLRLCSNNVFPPYEFVNEKGQPDGFDIDIIKALMKIMNRPYKISMYRWDIAQKRFQEKKEDVMMGVFRHEGLTHIYKYGTSYASLFHAAIYRRGSHTYNTIRSMKGRRVLLEKGDGMEILMRRNGLNREIIYVDNMVDGLKMLSQGKGDLAVGAMEMANYTIKKYNFDNLDMNGLEMLPEEFSFVCNDNSTLTEMDKAMIEIRKNGTYQALYDKWFVNYGKSESTTIIFVCLCGIIAMAIIGLFFIYLLRKKVAEAKDELSRKNKDLQDYANKLNYTFESCGIKVWKYDVSDQVCTMFSNLNNKIESITLEEFTTRLEPESMDGLKNIYHNISSGQTEPFSIQLKLKQFIHDKSLHYVIYNGIPEYDKSGNITSYFGLSRDVTEFINTQEHLKNEKRKAQIADKLKSSFLANMSHEIRTPLNSIVGFSQLIQETDDKEQRSLFTNIINENTENLLRIIDDILELSKIESGVMEIKNTEFDMAERFNVMANTIRDRLKNDNVEFIIENPYPRCIINSDPNRIAELLMNFGTNAIKYTDKGHIKIGYSWSGGYLNIYVEDTGKGIAKEDCKRIFQRFEKLNSLVQGTGLGLAICKAITSACSGRIGVDSEPNVGSTFWAAIPCERRDE